MSTLPERLASALLVVAALLTLLPLLPGQATVPAMAAPWLLQWRLMVGLLGLGLLAAAIVPSLRLAVVAGAVLSKLGFLLLAPGVPVAQASLVAWLEAAALLMLLSAGAMYLHAAQRQARWDGVLP